MVQNLTPLLPSENSMDFTTSITPGQNDDLAIDVNPYSEIPLTALSRKTRNQLSELLNKKKWLRSEEGYERDWRGIAALSEQKSLCDESIIDPITTVLQLWCTKNPETATFENLERFLGIIDRWDVCDDIFENLAQDAKAHAEKEQKKSRISAQQQTNSKADLNESPNDFGRGSDVNILTMDDVQCAQKGLPPQQYDAFVIFADADINYAQEILTKLEDTKQYNLKLCSKNRDLLGGVAFAHEALTQLIEDRCKHLIVILTKEFLKSPENKFFVSYTQMVQIQNNTRKIIPLIYEDDVVIPKILRIYTPLKYKARESNLFNFWTRLANSITNTNISTEQPAAVHGNENCVIAAKCLQQNSLQRSLNNLPQPPTDIPSININGQAPPDEVDYKTNSKEKERSKLKKRSSLRHTGAHKMLPTGAVMRNAHSTSQLNTGTFLDTNLSKMSDLSASTCSGDAKKKKKWPSKLFKKVFSRSSNRLREA